MGINQKLRFILTEYPHLKQNGIVLMSGSIIIGLSNEERDYLSDSLLTVESSNFVNSKGFDGQTLELALMAVVSASSIKALSNIIIALIKRRKKASIKIKINGRNIEIMTENTSSDHIAELIRKAADVH